MIWVMVVGYCMVGLGVALAMSAAGCASGSALNAGRAHRGAVVARTDAEIAARVARTVTGIGYAVDGPYSPDMSERIRLDLIAAAATAERINTRASRRRPASSHADVFVKPTT